MKTTAYIVSIIALFGLAAGCAGQSSTPAQIVNLTPTSSVLARGETTPVGTRNDDAADDPAIWRNAINPRASLIVGTDKKAGVYVYDLTGKVRTFNNAGSVNNVDLRGDVTINGRQGVLVIASDRNDLTNAKLALFELDTNAAQLRSLGTIPAGIGEAYGLCMYRDTSGLYAFIVLKDGTINQVKLDVTAATPKGQIVRTMKLGTQSEGCVADEKTGRLYVAEEDVGLWRFDARETGPTTATKIAAADGANIVADAEGVALADDPVSGRFILVSSQGDNAYAVYRADDDSYVGRFRIGAGAMGATEETDGIEVIVGDFGPQFPGGLFMAQDGVNTVGAQNFKLVSWTDIKAALGLVPQR
jgi:3-phytase